LLELTERYLKNSVMDGMEQWTPQGGTPQGAVITPRTQKVTFSLSV
jgi:hypothetical protein